MPSVARHLRKLCILGLLASPAYAADDWQAVTFISDTVGNHSNRLCMGVPDHMRGSDIGCPTYAPSLTTGGHVSITGNVSANRFIGDGSGLTNLNVQGDRIVSGTHAAVANEQSGIISLTTGANTWGYFSAGWSRLANLFADTVSSTVVSATHVSATLVDTARGGTVSGTYGYFQHISGTYLSGDGSGLYNVPASAVSGLNLDRITSGSHAVIANENTGYISLTTGASTWGYLSAGWSRLTNLFANTVSSTLVSATHVSATYVDTTRGGTVSGTYGYFHHISGTDIHGRFTGDGSGLTGVTAAASDRIVSGSTGGTRMVAISNTGFISITQAGANSGWFDPTRGLVTLGVSATGAISGTRGYFRETVGIGTLAPVGALHIAGLSHSKSVRLSSDLGAYTELGILNNTASWFDVNPHPLTASENSTIRFFRHVSTTGVAEVIFHRADGGGDPVAVIGNTRIALGMNGINVGIGLWSTGARLGVAGTISATDAIQVGNSSLTCGAGIAGALRYSGSKIEYCNGTAWGALVGAAEAMGDRIVSGSTSILAHQDRSLTFTTNNQQRMVIGEDGRVGIGTNSLAAALTVSSGTPEVLRFIGAGNTGAQSSAFVSFYDSNGMTRRGYLGDGSGIDTDIWMVAETGRLRLGTGTTQPNVGLMTLREGSVGIGTVTPTATLQVSGTISATNAIQVGASSLTCGAGIPGAIRYEGTNLEYCNGTVWTALGAAGATTAASSTGAVQFNVNNALAGDTNNLFWDNANKRLGIGTNTPPVALTVSSSSYEALRIVGHGATGGTSAGYMSFYDSNGTTRYGFFGDASSNVGDTSIYLRAEVGNLHFGDSSGVSVATLRGGKLGIGTVTPTATLQVSGSFTVSSSGQPASSPSMVVTNDGLVGIGVFNPAGQLANTDTNRLDHEGTGVGGTSINWLHHGAGYIAAFETLYNGVAGHGLLVKGGSNANNYLFNVVGGNQSRFIVRGDGNVGVGTTAPLARLGVAGTISASDAIQVGTSSLTCNVGLSGALRYNSTHSTMEYCNSAAWRGLGPSGTTVLGQVMRITTPQSIPNAVWTKVTFNHEALDTHNLINLGTHNDRITVPAGMGGYYLIESQGSYDSAGTNNTGRWVSLTRNGVQLSGSYCNGLSGPIGGYHGLNCTYMTYLSAGDYVGMDAYHNSSAALNLTNVRLGIVKLDGGGSGGGGGGANALNDLVDVNTSGANTGSILAFNGTQWVVSSSGAGALSGLSDVNLTGLAGRDYLRYDAGTSRWVNISESTVMSTTTMVPNWPDALNCSSAAGSASIVNLTTSVAGALRVYGFNAGGSSVGYQIHFNNDGSWNTIINSPGWADVAGCTGKTIAQLYAEGRAFNFIGNSGVSGGALGDRLTSGTHAVTVNTASGIISLTTGGTSWGYLASGNSYLPLLTSGRVSSTNISGTLIQAGASTAACNAGLAGGIRYSAVSNTLQVCTGATGWKSLTSGTAVSSLATLTDVNITNLAGRDYLRYDSVTSRWVNISESMVMSTTTMINAWPDAIMCSNSSDTGSTLLMVHSFRGSDSTHYYFYPGSASYYARFNGDGSYNTGGYQTTAGPHPCQNRTISQLYASGQAFNFIGNSATGGGAALGDRITSGTLAMVANSATGVVSLSTAGTTWGYLSSGNSYLPAVLANKVSATNVSATYLQLSSPTTVLACDSGLAGAMRYTSGTMQVCNGTSWGNIGIGVPAGTISAFAAASCPSGWVEYGPARGRFLRGIDNGAGNDPGGTRAPGHVQADALQNITGTLGGSTASFQGLNFGGAFGSAGVVASSWRMMLESANGVVHDFDASRVARTANETRPKNVAVIFCSYAGYQSEVVPGISTLGGLSDVSVGGALSGQVLAFDGANWVASNTTATSNALGDRIISGTHAVTVNTASGVVSLSTAGTTWGYLNSTRSYLPALSSEQVSSTNVSATLLQVGTGNGAECDAARRGAMRYSTTSNTLEYCNSSAWVSMGPSATAVPSFYVHRNGVAQNGIPNEFTTAIDWTHKLFDTNNNFNLADERFTPTVPGTYLLNGNAFCNSTNWCAAILYKNGAVIQDNYNKTPVSGGVSSNASVIVHANGTDYFEMRVYMTGTQLLGGQTQTNFSGVLISMAGGGGGGGGGGGSSALAGLADVNLTNLAGRDYLRYDAGTSRWVNISESTVMSTTTMVNGWPDAIACLSGVTRNVLYADTVPFSGDGRYYYRTPNSGGTEVRISFNADGTYHGHAGMAASDCVAGSQSIVTLYAEGKAFNLIGNAGAGGGDALGDRITSGTHAVTVNSATGVVSLSSAGTTWGYLSSGNSYLPVVLASRVSGTYVSTTAVDVTGNGGIRIVQSNAGTDNALTVFKNANARFVIQHTDTAPYTTKLMTGNAAVPLALGAGHNQHMFISTTGHVGIGNIAPLANLDVEGTISASNAIQVGNSSLTCNAGIRGAMRYSTVSSTMEYCQGSAWVSMGPSATAVPAFSVQASSAAIAAGAVKLNMTVATFDTHNNFDLALDRFTPTAPGYYLLTGKVTICGGVVDGAGYHAVVYKNGFSQGLSGNTQSGIGVCANPAVTQLVYANGTTDYFELYVQSTAGSALTAGGEFQGVLISMGGAVGGGGGPSDLAGLTDVNTAGASTGSILAYNGSQWVVSSSGAGMLSGLSDVNLTSLAGRDYLRYDHATSRWVNISESTVMSTTTIVPGWPDRIYCTGATGDVTFDYYVRSGSTVHYRPAGSVGNYAYMHYNFSTGAQTFHETTGGFTDLMTSCSGKSIAQLYADGQAFNLIGNSGANGGAALGDRITSGTHAVTVNSATGVVSLSTAGTTWGYLSSGNSYFPAVMAGRVSATNISATTIHAAGNVQAFSFLHPSDARLKSDIATIPNAVEILDALRGTQFTWTSNGKFSYGLIAQEIEKVMPSAVQGTDSKVVDYNQFIAVLVEGWKAHHKAIASLKADNDHLEQRVQNFELTNDGLRRWNLQLRDELEAVKADNDNLRAEFTALRGEVKQLRQANAP